jgi:FkbM family methyltransferase
MLPQSPTIADFAMFSTASLARVLRTFADRLAPEAGGSGSAARPAAAEGAASAAQSTVERVGAKRPTRNFEEFFTHVKGLGFSPETIIDVGVARGTPVLYSAFPDAYYLLFEPLADFRPEIDRILARYKGEFHPVALMAQKGEGSIFKTRDKFGSSMMHRVQDESDERLENVAIDTLDSVTVDGTRLSGPVMLKTDCQGGDFEVLKGGEKTLAKCDLAIIEVSFFRFWGTHHPDPLEILNFMDRNGFVVYDFLDGLFRPYDGALGQIDIVFVKKDGFFRTCHSWGA